MGATWWRNRRQCRFERLVGEIWFEIFITVIQIFRIASRKQAIKSIFQSKQQGDLMAEMMQSKNIMLAECDAAGRNKFVLNATSNTFASVIACHEKNWDSECSSSRTFPSNGRNVCCSNFSRIMIGELTQCTNQFRECCQTQSLKQFFRYCYQCATIKPDRSHHCSSCGRCVVKFDHHCPWINQCVNYSNYKSFVLYIIYSTATVVWFARFRSSFLCFIFMYSQGSPQTSQNLIDSILIQKVKMFLSFFSFITK